LAEARRRGLDYGIVVRALDIPPDIGAPTYVVALEAVKVYDDMREEVLREPLLVDGVENGLLSAVPGSDSGVFSSLAAGTSEHILAAWNPFVAPMTSVVGPSLLVDGVAMRRVGHLHSKASPSRDPFDWETLERLNVTQ
jgi:hypothetical protein